jgi:hypothetical protein
MKNIKRLCLVGVFTIVFATSTFAGDIQTGKPSPPPPDQPSATTPRDIDTPRATQYPQGTGDSVADIAMNLLQTMLAVF